MLRRLSMLVLAFIGIFVNMAIPWLPPVRAAIPPALLYPFAMPAVIVTALVEVGPAGFICISRGHVLYEYEPGRVLSHWGVLRDLPEIAVNEHFRNAASAIGAHATEIVVERVAVDMQSGLTKAQTRIRWSDGIQARYLVQLGARGHNWVSLDTPTMELMMCRKNFSNWVVGKVSPIAPTSE